jgi:hypothetical protein
LAGVALATVAALWFGVALLGPWALVSYFADFHGPRGLDHFQAMLTALQGLGDFGAFLARWLHLLSGA